MNYVIIGLGTAGVYATRYISSIDRNADITIIEKNRYESYSPCGIPFIIEKGESLELLKHPFPRTKRINVLINHEVIEIDNKERKIIVKNLQNGEKLEIFYDKLLFSAGAEPLIPRIKNANEYLGNGVFVIKRLEDAENLIEYIRGKSIKHVSVIGAGPIGLEMAYSMKSFGLNVSVFEMLPQVFPRSLDPDMAFEVEKFLTGNGIKIYLSSPVEEIVVDGEKVVGIKSNNNFYSSEAVILSAGFRPNTELLKNMVDMERSFIIVDDHMRSSDPNIYAAGDNIIVKNMISGEKTVFQIATVAAKQGMVAGINMAGKEAIYTGTTLTFVSKIGSLEIASTGLTETEASKKYRVFSARARGLNRPKYTGGTEILLKLICDENGKILGAQGMGELSSQKINVISMAIRKNSTVMDILANEMGYCPEVSELYDITNMAADLLIKKLNISKYIF
ncbi:MAG: FAD-dependent oxidoreductase [Thermoplasmata archaeon]